MANYFYILSGMQNGPVPQEQLTSLGVISTTLVWKEGMAEWMPAGQVAELASLFAETQVPPVAPPPTPGGTNNSYEQNSGKPLKPESHLVWAILTTILCCLPFGIVAIVYAAGVDGKYAAGDYAGAKSASKNALTWSIVAASVGVFFFLIFLMLGFLGSLL